MTSSSPAEEPVRRAGPADLDAVLALVQAAARAAETVPPDTPEPFWCADPTSPGRSRVPERERVGEWVRGAETWVVGLDLVRAVLVLVDEGIEVLAVDPALVGQGIPDRLLALAELRRGAGG